MALLYEVIAEQTSEEGVSRRRHQQPKGAPQQEKSKENRQLSLVPDVPGQPKRKKKKKEVRSPYKKKSPNKETLPIAAEESADWPE